MTYKPKRLVGLTIIITLMFVLFTSAAQRQVYASPGDAWADPTCKYRIKITFRNSASSTNLQNFPVLIVLNSSVDPQLYSRTSATDIRFYDGSTLLSKETEQWNSAGNSYIWVKVPQIDSGSSDYIYAYYKCSGASNPDDPAQVWDSFAMVLHLKETGTADRADSTSNGNKGTPHSVADITNGQIDGANDFNPGSSAYISVADKPRDTGVDFGFGSFSYSFWFKSESNATQYPLDKKGGSATSTTAGYKMTISTTTSPAVVGFSASLCDGSTANVRVNTGPKAAAGVRGAGKWAMFTCVVDKGQAKTMTVYINGTFTSYTDPDGYNNPMSIQNVGNVSNTFDLHLGKRQDANSNYFIGELDEVRISSVARSADWIKADYLSTRNWFITFGSPETGSRTIDSCDSEGVKKDDFTPSDAVNVKGTGGYAASTTYSLYVVSDVPWSNGMAIPTRVPDTETTVTSDADGNIPTTPVWGPTLKPGKYDIVVDVVNPGVYDEGIDALDDNQVQVTAGFFVIPEYAVGTILALAMCFGGVFVYRRYKHNKLKPF